MPCGSPDAHPWTRFCVGEGEGWKGGGRGFRQPLPSCTIEPMFTIVFNLFRALRTGFRPRADLVIENLALRQQLSVLRRDSKRPRLRHLDRAFWLLVS